MEVTSFYATMPSNASMNIYPNNTQASFQVLLPRTIYLKHTYEVALVEMQYPRSWKTFALDESYTILINMRDTHEYKQVFFPSGYYQSVGELIKAINTTMRAYCEIYQPEEHVKLADFIIEQKIKLETSENMFVKFSNECCDVLGLPHDLWFNGVNYSEFRYDLSRGFHSLFVYCNICEPQIVGDVYAPLIRSVAIGGKRGEHVIKSYGEPHYVPVNTKKMDSIEINIKDDTGHIVPFMSGKVVCKLHFRQRSL